MKQETMVRFSLQATNGSEISFTTDGEIEQFDDHKRLTFTEQTEILLKTTVDIYLDKVVLHRNGKIKMYMCFVLECETEVEMETDFDFQVKMLCKTLNMEISDNNIAIIYQTELDKESQVVHKLTLAWD